MNDQIDELIEMLESFLDKVLENDGILQKTAQLKMKYYNVLVEVGFNHDEAFQIVLNENPISVNNKS